VKNTDDPEIVNVHVVNPDEMSGASPTKEIEPEHFICSTYVVNTAQNSTIQAQVLALDLLRKDATILTTDNPIVICHTYRQTQDPNNQVAGVPNPVGAYLPAGASLSVSGTGPLWVVATVATPSRVSVAVNRRGSI